MLQIDSPPLAPLHPDAARFLDLHRHHNVVKWQWLMQDTQFRATTDRGRTATISRDDLDGLIAKGLMERGAGFDVRLTQKELVT